jgi:hypothetical protein
MLHLRTTRRRRRALVAGLAVLTVAGTTFGLAPGIGSASSHREAPLISGEPKLDNTDLYAYVAPDAPNAVTFVANWFPFEEPNGGPNYYPFATHVAHDINIDNNGDGRADITYRWEFTDHRRTGRTFLYNTGQVTSLTDPDLNFSQTYSLKEITRSGTKTLLHNAPVAPSRVGAASMPNYSALVAQAVTEASDGSKSFAGQADDPFFLDLRVFDLLYGANLSERGHDTLAGYNVNTIVFQVPKSDLALRHNTARNPVIGMWTTTSRRRTDVVTSTGRELHSGSYVQVSRLGMPLVNEVVVPLRDKDRFNATRPTGDAHFLPYVTNPEVPRLINAIYGIAAPATPRKDLVEVFLTGVCKACGPVQADLNSQLLNADVNKNRFAPAEELRLNMAVPPSASPNRLGVLGGDLAGFPNGRRLGDDVIDITLQAAEGVLLAGHNPAIDGLGDNVNANDVAFSPAFPYVALPHQDAVNQP